MKTPEEIAESYRAGWLKSEYTREEADDVVTDILSAIEVYREEIIRDMAEQAHPDDWGVPCVYVENYAKRLRGEGA